MISLIKKNSWGLAISIVIGMAAHFIAQEVSFLKGISVILAFIVGVMINNIVALPNSTKAGIKFSASKLLEVAIVFMAFSINFQVIQEVGWTRFSFLVLIITIILGLSFWLIKRFYGGNKTNYLVAFGTAICGSSAIAALSPMITDDSEDTGIAIAVVNLLGSIAMVIFPFVLPFFFNENDVMGFITGASLQSVGNVAGAGQAINSDVYNVAITVKLARVALLTPAVIGFSYLINRTAAKEGQSSGGFQLNIPLYLWLFVGITILNSVVSLPAELISSLKMLGKILLTISMAAIGLKVSFKQLWQSGKVAMGFGLLIFLVQIVLAVSIGLVF